MYVMYLNIVNKFEMARLLLPFSTFMFCSGHFHLERIFFFPKM